MPVLTKDELGRVQGLLDSLGYDLDPSILIGGWAGTPATIAAGVPFRKHISGRGQVQFSARRRLEIYA